MRAVFSLFGTKEVPAAARSHYAVEMQHLIGWGIFAGIVEGTTSNVVAIKTFHASDLLANVVYATPMVANILALSLSAISRGRPRVSMFIFFGAIATALLGSVAIVPANAGAWAGWVFAGQIALTRVFLAGLITLRTTLWQVHYPQSHRARIAGRLQTLRFFMGMMAGASVALLFDQHADYYRYVYPATALIGALSLLPMRRGREEAGDYNAQGALRDDAPATADAVAALDDDGELVAEAPRGGFLANLREAVLILRTDRQYARYCRAQYLMGSAAFFIDPLMILFVNKTLGFGYFAANVMLDVIPRIFTLISITPFARYFDRVGVLRFRVMNAAIWLAVFVLTTAAVAICSSSRPLTVLQSDAWQAANFAALWSGSAEAWDGVRALLREDGATLLGLGIALLVISRIVTGFGNGGGSIAWNLGHLHFAKGHTAELYMGIHVALTGVRGMVMPFVATALYHFIGWWSYFVAVGLGIAALVLFRQLARDHARFAASEIIVPEPATVEVGARHSRS